MFDRYQSNFIMFFKEDSKMSLVPRLAKKSEHWHELKNQKDAKLSLALRIFLFRSMFDAIQIQETVKNPTQLEAAQQLQASTLQCNDPSVFGKEKLRMVLWPSRFC